MRRLIVDVSSVCWMSVMAGKDKEYGRKISFNGKEQHINGIEFVHDNAMNHLLTVMGNFRVVPHQMIFVVEGRDSKALRRAIYPGYKGSEDRAPEFYELFNELKNRLVDEFLSVGASACSQDGIEADDVIAYLCQHLDGEKIIVSRDGDLSVLVGGDTHQVRMGEVDENPYGPFPHKYVTVYKALVGDTSDQYKGVHGFGEKAFLDLYVNFDDEGLEVMGDLLEKRQLARLIEDVPSFPKLQKIIDSADDAYVCWNLAKLYPQLVNTMRKPLEWRAGMVKMRSEVADERLHQWAGVVRLVTAENFDKAWDWARGLIAKSPFVALDIETSTPEESDYWLAEAKGVIEAAEKAFAEDARNLDDGDEPIARFKGLGVDVFGSELTGLGLTFGDNNQYTLYFSVDHKDTPNLTSKQVADVIRAIPQEVPTVAHNASFELSVLAQEWGSFPEWQANGWHGFLPNIRDTQIMASYVNENISSGLKQSSKHYLGYDQQTYEEVTQGRKMNQLTAQHVLSYGADDTRCTAALYNFFRTIQEIEHTWEVYKQVEIKPAYLLALAYVQGTPLSTSVMREMEKDDDAKYQGAWEQVQPFLLNCGWSGTSCPDITELTPATVKEAAEIILGRTLETKVRKLDRLADAIEDLDSPHAPRLADMVRNGDVGGVRMWVKAAFVPDPGINLNSPKQMRDLMYNHIGLPVRVVNNPTDKERSDNPALAKAVQKYKKVWAGKLPESDLTDDDRELLKLKAKTNAIAMDFAAVFDSSNPNVGVLKALKTMKSVDTRRKLFYRPYRFVQHWKDGRVHSGFRQVGTVTRRMSSSGPNLQQLPKKGDGVRFREAFVPHHKKAVVVSIDFSGQELRLGAEQSQDPNMLACYVGNDLKDLHALTASGAMRGKWGKDRVDELYAKYGSDLDPTKDDYTLFQRLRKHPETAKMADDLRKVAKVINFGSAYGAMAPKLAETLTIPVADAQLFLDARAVAFARVNQWGDEVREDLKAQGFVTSMMGARRHLRDKLLSDDGWEKEKALRQGPNYKIQGSAAEQTKLAMGRLWDSGMLFRLDARFIAPIHDELVMSVHRDHAVEAIHILSKSMTGEYAGMKVPVVASISLGPDFGHQHEAGDEFNAEVVQGIIDKIFEKDYCATT